MIGTIELILGLLLAVAVLTVLARKIHVAYPILFVIGGLILGFIPKLPTLHMNPQLVFVLFLPPLLYPAGFSTPWRDFHANLAPILRLAIGLVLLSIVVVAWFAHRYIGMPLAAGFVLGSIIAPPDALAATAITQGLRVPRRTVTILEGESLVNDGTSFTAYRFAVAAVTTGAFSLAAASFEFVFAVIGGLIVGMAAGWLIVAIQRQLDDPPVQTTLSLLTPYVAYLVADRLQVSGVLAVVVAGLYVGWHTPEIYSSRLRLLALSFWGMIVFILNGFLFILIGLQLPEVVHNLAGHSLKDAIWMSALVVLLLIVVRIAWFLSSNLLAKAIKPDSRCQLARPNWRNLLLGSWAGMRGVDSLAAALALPFATKSGAPFPERSLIVFITFSVILGTLVVQGLTLPTMIRWLRIVDDHSLEEEERKARLQANEAALARMAAIAKSGKVDERLLDRLRVEYEDRIQQLSSQEGDNGHQTLSVYSVAYEKLSREILAEERKTIVDLRNKRVINDHVLRRIQRDIDLAEAQLEREES